MRDTTNRAKGRVGGAGRVDKITRDRAETYREGTDRKLGRGEDEGQRSGAG